MLIYIFYVFESSEVSDCIGELINTLDLITERMFYSIKIVSQ